jgi:hypothetical protein
MPLWGGGRHRPASTAASGVSLAGVFIGLSVREETGDQVVLLIRVESAPESADLRGKREGVVTALRGEGTGPFWGTCIEGLTGADVRIPGSLESGGEFLVGAER